MRVSILCALALAAVAAVAQAQPQLYWSNFDHPFAAIERSNLDGSNRTVVRDWAFGPPELWTPWGVGLDARNNRIYFFEDDGFSSNIWRVGLDGSRLERVLLQSGLGGDLVFTGQYVYWHVIGGSGSLIRRATRDFAVVETIAVGDGALGVAVDELAGHLYWGITHLRQIWRGNLDGSAAQLVVTTTEAAHSLAIDPSAGMLYWAQTSAVYRLDLSGMNPELILPGDASAFAIDSQDNRIYYIRMREIRRADFGGMNEQVLVSGGGMYPLGLAIDPRTGACGDCILDGVGPDAIDVLAAARIRVGLVPPAPQQLAACDVNSSGAVDVLDVLLLAQAIVGLPVTLSCP